MFESDVYLLYIKLYRMQSCDEVYLGYSTPSFSSTREDDAMRGGGGMDF
jgi:hypothetical protein